MKNKYTQKYILHAFIVGIILTVTLLLSYQWHIRWDLSSDKRYTLSEKTLETLSKIQSPVTFDLYLKGDMPQEFRKLQEECLQLIEEYQAESPKILFNFIAPLENESNINESLMQMSEKGITPVRVHFVEHGKTSQEYIFPWITIRNHEHQENVMILKDKLGATDQERVELSVQHLEYLITDALHKVLSEKKKKIAILKSNGTLADIHMADFLKQIGNYYRIAPFTLDSASVKPNKTLEELNLFDLLIVPKPTKTFTDEQKGIIDQFIMKGGRILWLIDQVDISKESLYKSEGETMAIPLDLGLSDMFFSYGFRINHTLINDLYCTEIVVAQGEGNQTRYVPIPWKYNPMIISNNQHLINKNLDAVRLQFSNGIDTLKNGIKKVILLSSSELSKAEGTPRPIRLDFDSKEFNEKSYKMSSGNIPVSVLLEGKFSSMYKNRLPPFKSANFSNESIPTKMIVVADGDIIKNDINNGIPSELGYDKWTHRFFDNKTFSQNCVNYLLDENDFLALRNKKVQLSFLDKEKIIESRKYWEILSLLAPLIFIGIIYGIVYFIYRQKFITRT